MSEGSPVVLRNPSRAVVPAATSALLLIMFLPPLALCVFTSRESVKAGVGCAAVIVVAAWFAYAAWKAPIEARIGEALALRRLVKVSHYQLSQIRRWFFAIPNGLPTQAAPGSNAMLHITLADRTHFRGEVTADEAAQVAKRLADVETTNAKRT